MANPRKGTYWSPAPLDWEIIKRLPKQGSMIGYHSLATTARYLVSEINESLGPDAPKEARVTPNQVSGRLTSLKIAGLVVDVTVTNAGGTRGWQRTQKGEREYEKNTGVKLEASKPQLKIA